MARVVPVYKKGDRSLTRCYRPIAIVPVLSKIIEKPMHGQLVEKFYCNKMLSDAQQGFKKGRLTTTGVVRFVERVAETFEKEEPLGLTLLDVSKAFDVVSHEVLLEKLKNYGVGGVVLSTLKSYLKNRRQRLMLMAEPCLVSCLSTMRCATMLSTWPTVVSSACQ